MQRLAVFLLAASLLPLPALAAPFTLEDLFAMEWASDPQIAPDGESVVYVRNFADRQADRWRSNLWRIGADGDAHRPLTSGMHRDLAPRFSPDGERVAFVRAGEGGAQLHVLWLETGQTTRLSQLPAAPSGVTWSPDGRYLAFSMLVESPSEPMATLPRRPEGADWAEPAKVIDRLHWRQDGAGYLKPGDRHLFVIAADGGAPRQLTEGQHDFGGDPAWTPDGESLIFSANLGDDAEQEPVRAWLYRLDIDSGEIEQLTEGEVSHGSPVVSTDGRRVAFTGFDDERMSYHMPRLYVLDLESGEYEQLLADLDRPIVQPAWDARSRGVYFRYTSEGVTRLGYTDLDGDMRELARDMGGVSNSRPYGSGTFSVSEDGTYTYPVTDVTHPADVAVGRDGENRRVTDINGVLFAGRDIADAEAIWADSSHDDRQIQAWLVKPADFDPARSYPLILEIHGGPHSDYGPRFASELQLFASAGYLVLYVNPRGSTSYGEEFAQLIHHAYPSQDHDDLMSAVDAVAGRDYVATDRLYITGGSGGGVLTAWAISKTDRFRAAVVAKPVINWYSFALYADNPAFFTRYWFPAMPWEDPEHYMARSPISRVGEVNTPTMLLTGEADHRTPMPESEQYYQALQLRGVPSALVRIPDSSHSLSNRPTQLMSKVAHILAWFERHGGEPVP
ncbi:MAG: prolyl oligopeptidase family serine peptidase [Gammaproteobacteria bacterium]|jgi:acylaminoacyl-peptidase|nr:prolyl oligopeptidase family serine peptidase [Gammaproteobacteria bacterium]